MKYLLPLGIRFLLIAAVFASVAHAANFNVSNVDDSGPGSLRQAIVDSQSSAGADTITITATGVVGVLSSLPQITQSLTITGSGQTAFIVDGQFVDGRRLFDIVAAAGTTVTITDMTIRNGRVLTAGQGGGAAVRIRGGATVNLTNVSITGNFTSDSGAAIDNNGSVLNVVGSVIQGNTTSGSGTGGGGIAVVNGSLTLNTSSIVSNTSRDGGGLSLSSAATARIDNSTFSGNIGLRGGAIFNSATNLKVSNSTLSDNAANDSGGAIFNAATGATAFLRNCTVASNSAPNFGGGIYNAAPTAVTTTIANTIVAQNSASLSGADIYANEGTFVVGLGANIVRTAIAGGGSVSGAATISQVDPLLNPLAANGGPTRTREPQPTSPARDAGNIGEALDTLGQPLTTDQRGAGFPRVVGSAVDIGAFEFSGIFVTKTTDTNDGVCDRDCSLREAVATAPAGATIRFAPLFDTSRNVTLAGAANPILITRDVTIVGQSGLSVGVSGSGVTRIFSIQNPATVVLRNLRLFNGSSTEPNTNAGAIDNYGNLTIDNCEIYSNFSNTYAGGVGSFGGATLTVISSSITGNFSSMSSGFSNAGGISSDGTLTLVNSTISGNFATSQGETGGGVLVFGGNATIVNSTITDNSTTSPDNRAGGLWFDNFGGNGSVKIRNTIIAGNASNSTIPDVGKVTPVSVLTSLGSNLIGNPGTLTAFTAPRDQAGTAGAPLNPRLAPLAGNGGNHGVHVPLQDSTAINGGDNCVLDQSCPTDNLPFALTFDERGPGAPRKIANFVDIGAVEVNFTFNNSAPPNAVINTPYSFQISSSRALSFAATKPSTESLAPLAYFIAPGSPGLPPNLTLSTSGLISGTPTATGSYPFTVQVIDTADNFVGYARYTLNVLSPTAAGVELAGRVTSSSGQPVSRAIVTLTDAEGRVRSATTNSFGFYRFTGLAAGQTYVVAASSRSATSAPRAVSLDDSVSDFDLVIGVRALSVAPVRK